MAEFSTMIERAAGEGFSGEAARQIANASRALMADEPSFEETLIEMDRHPTLSNQDALMDALRYAVQHLPQKHIDHITELLNP